ncbi:hypothetical protein K523DRAFT_375563 [Schizophyllum commune Tattone D]|nr:hypothetical protein K523DRAFT_375563 [Schizophyllum commune Tattone D]
MSAVQVLAVDTCRTDDDCGNQVSVAGDSVTARSRPVECTAVLNLIGAARSKANESLEETSLAEPSSGVGADPTVNVDMSPPTEHEVAPPARNEEAPEVVVGSPPPEQAGQNDVASTGSSDDESSISDNDILDHTTERSVTPATSVEEGEPESKLPDDVVPVCDIIPLLDDAGESMPRDKFFAMVDELKDYEWASDSLFHPSRLPPTHPLLPFDSAASHPNLEAPLRALPTTLVVHDPSNVLPAARHKIIHDWMSESDWVDEADVLHVYRLHTGEAGAASPEERVAHLYLAKDEKHGTGHHSFVYQAELDVARTLLPGYRPELSTPSAPSDAQQDILAATLPTRDPEFAGVPGLAPPIARVRVAAKLSIRGDEHLAHEARMYTRFPPELAQHRKGAASFKKLNFEIPLGAVIPQFFGYYVPVEKPTDGRYLSPIMLVESCGTPIEGRCLNRLEKQTTASLFLRMHEAGFVQNSEFPRNVLMQAGPLSAPPAQRHRSTPSFRLIDFGRTVDKAEYDRAKRGNLKGTRPFITSVNDSVTFYSLREAAWRWVRGTFL